jgi:putative acetyltransferase
MWCEGALQVEFSPNQRPMANGYHQDSQTCGQNWMRAMDEAMDEQSTDRSKRLESARSEIEIRPLEVGEDGTAFRTLNEEWISRYFVLERKDRETLEDPDNTILRKGGRIFMVYVDGQAVGCVALIPMGDGIYELSKMAVSPELRGQGIGRLLLEHAIAQAKALGASSLFLGSNSALKNAVHLYEAVGFRHVPPEKLPDMHYARADVFMEMPL